MLRTRRLWIRRSIIVYEWQDDETIGKLLQEIRMLSNSVDKVMDIMRIKYPEYFKKQAEIIRQRPKYGP